MVCVIKNGKVYRRGKMQELDILIDDLGNATCAETIDLEGEEDQLIDAQDLLITAGFIDPKVVISKKVFDEETDFSMKGGYTTWINFNSDKIIDSKINHIQVVALSENQKVNDLEKLGNDVLGFVLNESLNEKELIKAMDRCSDLNCILFVDNRLSEKDKNNVLQNALETNTQIHFSDVLIEDLQMIQNAKASGINISCDISMATLLKNQEVAVDYIQDNIIEMISSTHGLNNQAHSGFVFGMLYSALVLTRKLSLEKLLDCLTYNCANIFGLDGGEIENFEIANFIILDLKSRNKIQSKQETTFQYDEWLNRYLMGGCCLNVCMGEIIFKGFPL